MWEIEPEQRIGTYTTIERENYVLVCPTTDVRPHDLESITCDCGIKVEIGEKGQLYDKPLYIHNRHEDNDLIDSSMNKIAAVLQ